MPVFIAMLWGGFASVLASMVGRVLVAMFITYVTYQGVDILLTSAKDQAFAALGNMGALSGVVGMMKLSESINIVFSAVVAKYTLKGMTNGSITSMVFKK